MNCAKLRQAIGAIGDLIFVCVILLSSAVDRAQAVDLTWMAQEQNCKQFIRKFQGELRGESGIKSLPEQEQNDVRAALRKACAGAIGRCEFSFCSMGEAPPVVIYRPPTKVDIGALLKDGEEIGGAKQVAATTGDSPRVVPTLPPDRMVPVKGATGEKGKAEKSSPSTSRERHPLYDPRERRLLDELNAEDAAETKRKADMKAAEERVKEQLLRELGRPEATALGEPDESGAELAAIGVPSATPTASPTPGPTEMLKTIEPRATDLLTPESSEGSDLPEEDFVRLPSSPWSRAGTFPRAPISESAQSEFAPAPVVPTAEELAKAAEAARAIRLAWLKPDLSCKQLLTEIKTRYSDVRPASGFSAETKLDLWEVLNTACSPQFSRCKFPQCAKLKKLTARSTAREAAEEQAATAVREQLTAAAQSDLVQSVAAVAGDRGKLIRDAEQREKKERRSWQKVQMQSEIMDRQRPASEPTAASTPQSASPRLDANKSRYDPKVYATPSAAPQSKTKGTTTSATRVRASQPTPPAAGPLAVPRPGRPRTTGAPPAANIF